MTRLIARGLLAACVSLTAACLPDIPDRAPAQTDDAAGLPDDGPPDAVDGETRDPGQPAIDPEPEPEGNPEDEPEGNPEDEPADSEDEPADSEDEPAMLGLARPRIFMALDTLSLEAPRADPLGATVEVLDPRALPPGVDWNPESRRFEGRPTRLGQWPVAVQVVAPDGQAAVEATLIIKVGGVRTFSGQTTSVDPGPANLPRVEAEFMVEDNARLTRGPWLVLPSPWQACRDLRVSLRGPGAAARPMRPAPELGHGVWVLDLEPGVQASAAGTWRVAFEGTCLANEASSRRLELAIDNRFGMRHPGLVLVGADERLVPFAVTPGAVEPDIVPGVDGEVSIDVREGALAIGDVDPDHVHLVQYDAHDGDESSPGHLTVWRPHILQRFPGPHALDPVRTTRLDFEVDDPGETSMAVVCVTGDTALRAWPEVSLVAPDGRVARAEAEDWVRGNEQRWCADLSRGVMKAEMAGRWTLEVHAAARVRWSARAIDVAVGRPLGGVPMPRQFCMADRPCEIRFEFVNGDARGRGRPLDAPDFGAIEGGIEGISRDPGLLDIPVILSDGTGQSRLARMRVPVLDGLDNDVGVEVIPDGGEASMTLSLADLEPDAPARFAGGRIVYQIEHDNPCQLRVSLTAPNGRRVMVRDRECDGRTPGVHDVILGDDPRLAPLIGAPLAGDWILTVRDMSEGVEGHIRAFEIGWMNVPAIVTAELRRAVTGEAYRADIEHIGLDGEPRCRLLRGTFADGLELVGCRVEGQLRGMPETSAVEVEVYDPERDRSARRIITTPAFERAYPANIVDGILDPHSSTDFPIDAPALEVGDRLFVGLELDADRLEDLRLHLCRGARCLPVIGAFAPPGHRLAGWFGLDLVADTPLVVPPDMQGGDGAWRLQVTNQGPGRITLLRWMLGVREPFRIIDHDLPPVYVGQGYDHSLRTAGAPGGDEQVLWRVVEGRLPRGIDMGPDGKLAGQTLEGGVFPVTVEATALMGEQLTGSFTLRAVAHEVRADAGWAIPDGPEDPFAFAEGELLDRCVDDVAAGRADAMCASVPLDVPAPLDGLAMQVGVDWEHAAPVDVDLYLLPPGGEPMLLRSGGGLVAASMSDTFCNEYDVRSELRGALAEEDWQSAVDTVFVGRGERVPDPEAVAACGELRDDVLEHGRAADPLLWNDCCAWFADPIRMAGTAQGTWHLLAIDNFARGVGRINSAQLSVFADNPAFFAP